MATNYNGIDEEELRRQREEAERIAREEAEAAQARAAEETVKAQHDANAAQEAAAKETAKAQQEGAKVDIGPTNRPFTDEQSFLLHQRAAVRETETDVVKVGDLDRLPLELEPHREMLEERNREGKIMPSAVNDWGTNRIDIDIGSVKDDKQAAYFATTLATDSDKLRFFSEYAKKNNLSYEKVVSDAEKMLGDRLFSTPQTNAGKSRAGMSVLAGRDLYDPFGNELDLNVAKANDVIGAIRNEPDDSNRKKLASAFMELTQNPASPYYGVAVDADMLRTFRDSKDLPKSVYKEITGGFSGLFSAMSDDESKKANLGAYTMEYNAIMARFPDSAYAQKVLLRELNAAFKGQTDYDAPDQRQVDAVNEAMRAARELAQQEDEDERSLWSKVWDAAEDFFSGFFPDKEKSDAPTVGAVPEENEPEAQKVAQDGKLNLPGTLVASASPTPIPKSDRSSDVWNPKGMTQDAPDIPQTIDAQIAARAAANRDAAEAPEVEVQDLEPHEQKAPTIDEQIAMRAAAAKKTESRGVHLAHDPSAALEYANAHRYSDLDAETQAKLNDDWKNSGAQILLGVLTPEMLKKHQAGNEPADRIRRMNMEQLGDTLNRYSMIASGEDFPNALYGDMMYAMKDVTDTVDELIRSGDKESLAWYDPYSDLPAYEQYIEAYPDSVAGIENVLKELNGMREEKAAHDAQIKANDAQLLEDARTACINGVESAEQRVLVEENTQPLSESDRVKDPTYANMLKQIEEEYFAAASYMGSTGGFYESWTYKTMEARGVTNAGYEQEAEYFGMLQSEMKEALRADMDVAASLGMTLEQYYARSGGTNVESLAMRAHENLTNLGAQITEAEGQVLDAAYGDGIGNGELVGGSILSGYDAVTGAACQAVYTTLQIINPTVKAAKLESEFKADFGPFLAKEMYAQVMAELLATGTLTEALAKEVETALAGGVTFELAIDPYEYGIVRNLGAQKMKSVEEWHEYLRTNGTQTQNFVGNALEGITSNVLMFAAASVTTGALGAAGVSAKTAQLLGMMNGYGPSSFIDNLNSYSHQGYTVRESAVLAAGRVVSDAAANVATFGRINEQITGVHSLFTRGVGAAGGAGTTKALNPVIGMAKAVFKGVGDEVVVDTAKEGFGGAVSDALLKPLIDANRVGELGIGTALKSVLSLPAAIPSAIGEAASDVKKAVVGEGPVTARSLVDNLGMNVAVSLPLVVLGAVGENGEGIRASFPSVKAAKKLQNQPTAENADAFAQALVDDVTNSDEFVDSLNAAGTNARIAQKTAVNLLTQADPVKSEQASAKHEQAAAHKIELEASQTREQIADAAYYERKAVGDVAGAIAMRQEKAKAEQGIREHQRELDQNVAAEDKLRGEMIAEAKARATAQVRKDRERAVEQVRNDTTAQIREYDRQIDELSKREAQLQAELEAADASGDEDAFFRLSDEESSVVDQIAHLQEQSAELTAQASIGETNAEAYVTDVSYGTDDPVTQRMASELRKNTGITLVVANLEDGKRGWYNRKSGELVLSNKLGAGEIRRIVVMHELTHHIENSPGYAAYKKAVLDAAYEGGEDYRAQMLERDRMDIEDEYARSGIALSPEDVEAELVAAATERVIGGDEAFFDGLIAGGKRPLLTRVYMKVKGFLARRKAKKAGGEMLAHYDAIQRAHDLMEKALKGAPKGSDPNGKTQYALGWTADGRQYVEIEEDILDGVPEAEWAKAAKDALKRFSSGIPVGRNTIYVSKKTRGEWTNSKDAKRTERLAPDAYMDKLRAANHADEILWASADYINEEADHNRTDNMQDFARGKVLLSAGGNGYQADVVVGLRPDGSLLLYDVTYIEPVEIKKKKPQNSNGSRKSVPISQSVASDISVQQNASDVNNQPMQNGRRYSVGVRMFGNNSAQRADFISDEVKRLVRDTPYERDTNREQVARAIARMDSLGGADGATAVLLNKTEMFSADDNALTFVAMAEATRNGDNTTAAMLAMCMNEKAGATGSALQSLQIAGRLTPEGAMAETIRKADRSNARHGVPAGSFPIGEQEAKDGGTTVSEDGKTTEKTPEAVERVYRDAQEVHAEIEKLSGEISYDNPWNLPLSDKQMELIRRYRLTGEKLTGVNYNVATVKERMLAAIIATGPNASNRALKALGQQLAAMKKGHAVVTKADLNYTASQMSEFRLVEGADAITPTTQAGKEALGRAHQAQDNVTQESLYSKWTALRFMNMLSAPATAVRNVTSNVLAGGLEGTATRVAAYFDRKAARKTGTRTTTWANRQEKKAGKEAFAAETAQTFVDYFVTHVDTGHGRKYATGGQGRVFESEFLEGCRNLVDFAMQIGDRPFFERSYAEEMAIIKRLGMKKTELGKGGKIVSREMTQEEMHEEATARALKRVFQEDSDVIDAINSLKAKHPAADLFISTLMPFIKTPTNVAMRAVEYSPVGLLATIGRRVAFGMENGKALSISQRDYVMGMGRGLTGTGLMMLGYALAAGGVIGFGRGEEEDKKRRDVLSALGEPYSMYIRIGDTKHEIDWALPMSSAIAIGAELWRNLEDGEGMGMAAYGAILSGVGDQIMSTPMLASINDIFRGYGDTEDVWTRIWETVSGSLINQTLSPAVIRAIAKATDPYVRDTSDSNPVWASLKQNLFQYWPGVRQMLPIKADMTGDKQLQSGYWNLESEQGSMVMQCIDSFLTPTATIGWKNDDALCDLIDLSYRTGEGSFLPADLISKNKYELKLNKEYARKLFGEDAAIDMALSDEEKRRINQAHGDLLFNGDGGRPYADTSGTLNFPGLRAVMNNEAMYAGVKYYQRLPWSRLNDEERCELVKKMVDDAKRLIILDTARKKRGAGEI